MSKDAAEEALTYVHFEKERDLPLNLLLKILEIEQRHLFDTDNNSITKKIEDLLEGNLQQSQRS